MRGSFVVELDGDADPIGVASFVGFSKAKGYDGLLWHRVDSDYII
jgi:cyclophilin family peptidyl-prolyl cis-trans isomerase